MFDRTKKAKDAIKMGMGNLSDVMDTISHVQHCPTCQVKFKEIIEHTKNRTVELESKDNVSV